MLFLEWLFKPNIEKLERRKDTPGLIKALGHKSLIIRRDAARALWRVGDESCIEHLVALLDDEDSYVRFFAVHGLSRIGGGYAVEALIKTVKTMINTSGYSRCRGSPGSGACAPSTGWCSRSRTR